MFISITTPDGPLNVHVRIGGPAGAPVLVLLHSLGTNQGVWDAQAAALGGMFRVVRPDMRGHGLTETTPGPYTMEGLAADVLALMDALGVEQAHVGGISIGGMIAQSLAAMAPERVQSLVLCDTAMTIPTRQSWAERAAAVRAGGMAAVADTVLARWVTPDFLGEPAAFGLRAMLLRTDPEGYAACAEAIGGADLRASTGQLRLPALVLVGDQDVSTPPSSAQALAEAIPGAELMVLEDAAHIPTVQQPRAVAEAMRGFLAPVAADPYEAGMAVRRAVLGEAHVERASAAITDMDRDFQRYITQSAWGSVWTRPGLDRRTRSLLTMALMAALGHHEEMKLHVRAARNTGASAADMTEVLIQVAAYAGIPAANSAMRVAKETLQEMDES
jgi:3-oxoadipate enol-lactonase/4-carboxymuconolactone decarboxylase